MMAAALLLALFFAAQDKPAEKCTLSGSVVSAATGEPLNRVEIFAEPIGGHGPATTATDSKGNFTLVDLPVGEYSLKGRRNGFLDTYYGSRRSQSRGTTITLEPGESMKDIQIKLVPFAVLAGTVRETDGEPLAGADVTVYSWAYNARVRQVYQVDETRTDDLGQYRIANLPPGKYYIRAEPYRTEDASLREDHSPKEAPREVLLPALYPGVVDPAAARPVEAAAGARVTGLDIMLPRSRVFRVTGRITAPQGATGHVVLESSREFETLGSHYKGIVKSNGDFEIAFVPTGSYVLVAEAVLTHNSPTGVIILDSGRRFRASMPLDVGSADVADVRMAVNPGPEVDGHITVEGATATALTGGVEFEDVTGRFSISKFVDGQVFSTVLSPGTYNVLSGIGQPKFVIKSIRSGPTDVLRDGLTVSEPGKISLEIVLAPDGGQINGVVLDKGDKPAAGATVVLVPEPALRGRSDRFDDSITDQNGRYQFENVAPGDYKVFAWDDIQPGSWLAPDFFRDIESSGETVKLNAKGHETVKLHIQ